MPYRIRTLPLTLAAIALAGCARRGTGTESLPVYQMGVVDPGIQARLLGGFDEIHGGWRWTAAKFVVSLDVPADRPIYLVLDAGVPRELLIENKAVTLIARINGHVIITGRRYDRSPRYPCPPTSWKDR